MDPSARSARPGATLEPTPNPAALLERSQVTSLLLVRHGHTEGNGAGPQVRMSGSTDLPLSAAGRAEAALVGAHVAREHLSEIVHSSPLIRALDTATEIRLVVPVWKVDWGTQTNLHVKAGELVEDCSCGLQLAPGPPLRPRKSLQIQRWRILGSIIDPESTRDEL